MTQKRIHEINQIYNKHSEKLSAKSYIKNTFATFAKKVLDFISLKLK